MKFSNTFLSVFKCETSYLQQDLSLTLYKDTNNEIRGPRATSLT